MKDIRITRFLVGFIAFALILTGVYTPVAEGVPAMPGDYTHVQKDGTVITYQLYGDEFLSYMIDSNGNLVDFGQDGDIYLARWAEAGEGTGTIPTNEKPPVISPIMRSLPQTITIPQHLVERAEKALAERDAQWQAQASASPVGFSAMQASTLSVLERKVLMIYVYFEEDGGMPTMQRLRLPSAEELYTLMYDENTFGTVAHYYKTVTNGTAKVVPAATNSEKPGIIFVQLPGSHRNWGRTSDNDPRYNLVTPALIKTADPINPGGSIDYSKYDNDGNGTIIPAELSIGFIVHGYESSSGGVTATHPSIWGHAWSIPAPGLELNGVRVRNYFAQGAFHNRTALNPPILTMGILAHELGHSCFGFTDLYDTGGASGHRGTGYWSLMASGSWGGAPSGSSPTRVEAFHLYGGNGNTQLVPPVPLVSPGLNTLTSENQYVILPTSDARQYFTLEPRGDVGYDRGFLTNNGLWATTSPNISGGLLVSLVDNNLTGSNNLSTRRHYRVAIVEAGWTRSMDVYNLSVSRGNPGMLFDTATKSFLNDDSMPSTKRYAISTDVYPTVPTGWNINSISSYTTGAGTRNGVVHTSFRIGAPTGLTITQQPQDATAIVGGTARFSVGVSGAPDLAYQWMRSNDGGLTWSSITGAMFPICTFTATAADFNALYRVVVFNITSEGFNIIQSNTARLLQGAIPAITVHPLNQSVNAGEEATFKVTANNAVLYQWARSNNNGSSWSNVSGATFDTYSITTTSADTNALFRVTVTNVHGTATSSTALLTVSPEANNMMSASPIVPFGYLQVPYAQPAAQTVTITNTGTGSITLTQPTAVNHEIGLLSKSTLAANGDTATFTVRPKAGLPIGNYYEAINIKGNRGANASVLSSFTLVNYRIPVTGISLNITNASIAVGDTLQLTATVSPSNATNRALLWRSSLTQVATVNESGLVTAVRPGTTYIVVRAVDSGHEISCALNVTGTMELAW